jgi:hypothetical protein
VSPQPQSNDDFPQYTEAAQKGNKGVRIVENIVHDQFGWIFREQEGQKDFGIDAQIELSENGKVLGKVLAVQIKCGESFFRQTNDDGFIFNGARKHLNYFINYPLPILIILCDPNTRECWWSVFNPLETEDTASGWRITIPYSQRFNHESKAALAALAGPAKDYLPELEEYWRLNKLMEQAEFLHLVIPREDIETGNIDAALSILNRIRATQKLTQNNREKVDLSVFGYEDDPRELFEIPRVRAWVRKLDKAFPYWFFFFSKQLNGLKFITYSLCNYRKYPTGGWEINNRNLAKFMENHFPPMNEICTSLGYTENEIKELTDNVFFYYYGFKPPQVMDT